MVPEQKHTRPTDVHALVCRLIELGYLPVPIPAGVKGPTITGWQNLRMTAEQVPQYFDQPNMLVGILHKNTGMIDIDVYDPELSETIASEARKRFPGSLERVGQYPKTAIVFGLDPVGFKVQNTIKGKVDHDGKELSAQVEIRTLTRQAVVYGTHPETQQLYKWVNGPELWETKQSDLPIPTKEEIEDFRNWADEQIREWAGIKEEPQPVVNIGVFHPAATNDDDRASEEQFLEALKHTDAGADYDTWLQCLMGIHDFYSGSQTGLSVAQSWSSDYPAYSANEVILKWRSFEVGKGIGYKTVFALAKQNGADLSAIARMGRQEAPILQGIKIATEPPVPTQEGEQPDKPTDALEWFDDIKASLTDAYLIKGVLAADTMSVIYGPSNSGKTFFALDLAFHVATGRQWRGLRVKQAGVLYLAAEGGRGVLNRVVALKMETGVTSAPIAVKRAGMDLLHSEADLQAVFDMSQDVRSRAPDMPLLIVIDTLSRIMAGGDENSAADMTALIRNIDAIRAATNAHVMLVHHTGKDTARGARGHSSLRAATDTEIEVQNEDGKRAAQVQKQRDYQGSETFAFSLKGVTLGIDQDGDEVTSCVVEATDRDEFKAIKRARKKRGKNQTLIMETFDQMLAEGLGTPNHGGVGMPDRGQFWTVDVQELRRISQAKMVGDNAARLFRQAWGALTDKDGIFVVGDKRTWRIDRKK